MRLAVALLGSDVAAMGETREHPSSTTRATEQRIDIR